MTFLDNPLLSQRVFFPRSTDREPSHFVDVEGCRIACYWQKPSSEKGTVLHFHGNGELASDYAAYYADIFLSRGLNVCFVEYRGYGLSTGVPDLVAMLGDGERVVQALGLNPERLIVFGRSLGSLYAIELAHRIPHIAGLIVESGIADLLEDWPFPDELRRLGDAKEGLIQEVKTHFDLQHKLNSYQGHLLVMHAKNDHCLDRSHAERLYAWSGSCHKRLVLFPEGDHNTIFSSNAASYLNELAEFIRPLGRVSRFRLRYSDSLRGLVDDKNMQQRIVDLIAREYAEDSAHYFEMIIQKPNHGEVWQKGLAIAREWLRLINSDPTSQTELQTLLASVHANRYRTCAWYEMAFGIYDWVRSKGIQVLPPEQFFAREFQPSRQEIHQTKPADLARSFLKIFEEYHQEDPSSKAWSSGIESVQQWLRLIENQAINRFEVSALVDIVLENEGNFRSSVWTRTLFGVCFWCKTIGYPDLIPEGYDFLLKPH